MAILVQSNKKPSVTFPSQTGLIVTFNSGYAGLPLKSCVVNIPVTQEGTGDPSPDNVRNFVGIDSLDFSATGKNLFNKTNYTPWGYLQQDGTIGIDRGWCISDYIPVEIGIYYSSGLSNGGSQTYMCVYDSNKNFVKSILIIADTPNIIEVDMKGYIRLSIRSMSGCLATAQLERNNEPTDYEPFGNNKLFSFGQTIYAGELDVLTGMLTATHGYISSYNGETINEPWISSMDIYVEGTSPTIGAQVVYPLPTPEVINLGGMDISTLQGDNNLFASTGETTASYIKIGG